ncbi:MAG: glycosyltransferase family 2 protein, partial [Chthonomonadales bacterium]
HNRCERLLNTLQRVCGGQHPNLAVIVVFDGCTDGSQEEVRRSFPEVRHVEGDGTLWWSGAINAGIAAARDLQPDYICLMNDDVDPHPNMFDALLKAAQANPGAIVGPLIAFRNQPDTIWCAGGRVDWLRRGTYMDGNGEPDGPAWAEIRKATWLPGMGSLIPWSVVQQLGGMDAASFPQYFGDTDFTLRAHRAGIPLLVCPEARLYNDVASTGSLLPPGPITWQKAREVLFSMRSHANIRTRLRFWMRHCPIGLVPWQAMRFYIPLLAAIAKKLMMQAARARRGNHGEAPRPTLPSS